MDRMTHWMTKVMRPGHQLALKRSHSTDHRVTFNPQHTASEEWGRICGKWDSWDTPHWTKYSLGGQAGSDLRTLAPAVPSARALQGSLPYLLRVLSHRSSPQRVYPDPPVKTAPSPLQGPRVPLPISEHAMFHMPTGLAVSLPPQEGSLQEGGDPLLILGTADMSCARNNPDTQQTLHKYLPLKRSSHPQRDSRTIVNIYHPSPRFSTYQHFATLALPLCTCVCVFVCVCISIYTHTH